MPKKSEGKGKKRFYKKRSFWQFVVSAIGVLIAAVAIWMSISSNHIASEANNIARQALDMQQKTAFILNVQPEWNQPVNLTEQTRSEPFSLVYDYLTFTLDVNIVNKPISHAEDVDRLEITLEPYARLQQQAILNQYILNGFSVYVQTAPFQQFHAQTETLQVGTDIAQLTAILTESTAVSFRYGTVDHSIRFPLPFSPGDDKHISVRVWRLLDPNIVQQVQQFLASSRDRSLRAFVSFLRQKTIHVNADLFFSPNDCGDEDPALCAIGNMTVRILLADGTPMEKPVILDPGG